MEDLECKADSNETDWPKPIFKSAKIQNLLTVVIVTARPEFSRLPLTLSALAIHLDRRNLFEVMFLVPAADIDILRPFFTNENTKTWPWPVSIRSDDLLLRHRNTNSYRLQMMLKLFVAQIISTEFYLVLDSDCVAIWPIHVEQLLYATRNPSKSKSFRAIYQIKSRTTHADWWNATEMAIKASLDTCQSTNFNRIPVTMGVTPIILSQTIALMTICRLIKLYGKQQYLDQLLNWALWRLIHRSMWTEYTMYFLTAHCTNTFYDYYHHHAHRSISSLSPQMNLYGSSIWSSADWTHKNQQKLVSLINEGLNWRQKENQENDGKLLTKESKKRYSYFTVLQSRKNVDPMQYQTKFYPLFIDYLKKNKNYSLVELLEKLKKILIP